MPANFVAFLCGRHKKVINACRCKRGVQHVKERERVGNVSGEVYVRGEGRERPQNGTGVCKR